MSYEVFRKGLDAPICLTWEITYGCNLRCVHCLSSSGKRRRDELTTAEAKRLIDEWAEMKVFYINVGGGEPMSRPDFFELMDYALDRGIGVKFSTNGTLIDDARRRLDRLARLSRRADQHRRRDRRNQRSGARRGLLRPRPPRHGPARRARRVRFKINATVTRHNYPEIDDLYALAARYGAELRLTRLRPTGRGADVWDDLRPTHAQNRGLYDWLLAPSRRADRRLLLPSLRLWRADGRTEHVRRRPHRLLRRSGGRGLCLSVHAGAGVLRRQRPRSRAASPASGATRRCSRTCASGRSAAAARVATPTTAATAAAWR